MARAYGHFLVYRYKPIVLIEDYYQRLPEREHFADHQETAPHRRKCLEAKIVFSQDCIILDACCIINLYASGQMGDILKSISKSLAVESMASWLKRI